MYIGASDSCSLKICPGECCHLGEVPGAGFTVGGWSRWLLALSAGRVASTSDSLGVVVVLVWGKCEGSSQRVAGPFMLNVCKVV